MNFVLFTDRGFAAVEKNISQNRNSSAWEFSGLKIRITREYRELRSPSEMRKLMNRKIVEQGGQCALCQGPFTDYGDIKPDHRNPKGMGGAWRDGHPENIQAAHWWCNEEKGSTRID
jgi:hypothetical protein